MKKKLVLILMAFTVTTGNLAQASPETRENSQRIPDVSVCQYLQEAGITEEELARRGCCSHHGGVCGCSGSKAACCDCSTNTLRTGTGK